jgi:hypothetical protein
MGEREQSRGPHSEGRAADPFGQPEPDEERPRPGPPYREVPIGSPVSSDAFEELKRSAETPEPGPGEAQIDDG